MSKKAKMEFNRINKNTLIPCGGNIILQTSKPSLTILNRGLARKKYIQLYGYL